MHELDTARVTQCFACTIERLSIAIEPDDACGARCHECARMSSQPHSAVHEDTTPRWLELLDHLRRNTDVLSVIADTGKLAEETEQQLAAAVEDFRLGFLKGDGSPLVGGADADEDEGVDVEQEQIVRQKKA